jgi:DNA-binding phage protein
VPLEILTQKDVVQLLRREVAKAGGQTGWSKKTGVHRSLINKILQGREPLTKSILKALGLEIVYGHKQKKPRPSGL